MWNVKINRAYLKNAKAFYKEKKIFGSGSKMVVEILRKDFPYS